MKGAMISMLVIYNSRLNFHCNTLLSNMSDAS